MSRVLIRTGKHGSIYTKEVSIGRPPLNGCMCQDGSCEACNRVAEAWEVMRAALYRVLISRLVELNRNAPDVYDEVDKAIMLADQAAKGKP